MDILGLISGIFGGILGSGVTIFLAYKILLPRVWKSLITSTEMLEKQLSAATARTARTAQAKISKDLIQNTPLGAILQYLSEDTVEYILNHPDALPEIIRKWLPVIKAGVDIIPQILGMLQQQPKKGMYEL